MDIKSDNYKLRSECLLLNNLDIIGVAETHLFGDQCLYFPGYTWYGQNRTKHTKAKKGSGGIGFFIKHDVSENYIVETLDSEHEGILWIQCRSKRGNHIFNCCVCYVPPSESTRSIDLTEFYDTLMHQVHIYCQDKQFFICGDFNGRVGDLEDYIPGVDILPERNVVDFHVNKEGERLCDFLIDTDCCILNGRNCAKNDYTFIGSQGSSVVDYCFVPYESLDNFSNFRVTSESDLFNSSKLLGTIEPETSHPDHSLLMWDFLLDNVRKIPNAHNDQDVRVHFTKFDRHVPDDFLNTRHDEMTEYISRLEGDLTLQDHLDKVYSDLVVFVKDEMVKKINHRQINAVVGHNNKKRKVSKPWWSEQLTELWNNVCKSEKNMLKSKNPERNRLRAIFVGARKVFNQECQRAKRRHQKNAQMEIPNLDTSNSKDFWKRIGKIGVGKERQNQIPMEVILPSGEVSCNTKVILEVWRKHFQDLLNPNIDIIETNREGYTPYEDGHNVNVWNSSISTSEIIAALRQLNDRKAEGIDEIPAEIWKTPNLLAIIEALFNQCFRLGKIPELWKCGIITPVLKASTSDKRVPSNYRGITITPAIYKLYCNVINNRLLEWEKENNVICEPQNGFRKGRSTIDHVQSITSIIETRKLKRQSTFVAFIDFTKAYDSINRKLLFSKLENLGLTGHIYNCNENTLQVVIPLLPPSYSEGARCVGAPLR